MRSRALAAVLLLCLHVEAEEREPAAMENNVCPTFEDYRTMRENSRCWYNFAADSTAVSVWGGRKWMGSFQRTIGSCVMVWFV